MAGHAGAGKAFGYFVENKWLLWGRFAPHFRVVADEKLCADFVQIREKDKRRLRGGGRQDEIVEIN